MPWRGRRSAGALHDRELVTSEDEFELLVPEHGRLSVVVASPPPGEFAWVYAEIEGDEFQTQFALGFGEGDQRQGEIPLLPGDYRVRVQFSALESEEWTEWQAVELSPSGTTVVFR